MNEDVDLEEPTTQPTTDVAERLLLLMQRINTASTEVVYPRPGYSNQDTSAASKPLFQVFDDISKYLDFGDYSKFQSLFVGLCDRVIKDVGHIDVKNEKIRKRWIDSVKIARSVFNADNFGKQCGAVFDHHFSESVRDRIEDASERLQTIGRTEAKKEELSEALDAARETLSAFEVDGKLPSEISNILKHYIQQIENAFQSYDDFGEDRFWSIYKELFATFVQTHPIIAPKGVSEDMKKSINNMAEKMSYGLRGLSVGADLVAITTAGAALLTLAG